MVQLTRIGTMMGPPQSSGETAGSVSLIVGPTGRMYGNYQNGIADASGLYISGVDEVSGEQWGFQFDLQGNLVDEDLICDDFAQPDNHDAPPPLKTPLGGMLFVSSGHAISTTLRFRYASSVSFAALGAQYTATAPDVTTYPEFFTRAAGQIDLNYRGDVDAWYLATSTNDGADAGGWTFHAQPYVNSPEQCYSRLRAIPTTPGLYLMRVSDNPNKDNAASYSGTVNAITGAVKNAAGTTLSNFITGSPKFTASISDLDLFYEPGAGNSSSAGNLADNLEWGVLGVQDNDNQFLDLYESVWNGVGDKVDPASWSTTALRPLGYGVGSTTNTPFSYLPRSQPANEAGIGHPRLYLQKRFRGYNYAVRMDKVDGTWFDTCVYVNRAAQNLDHNEGLPWLVDGPSVGSNVVGFSLSADHADYDSITNSTISAIRIIPGTKTPVITVSASQTVEEYKDKVIALTADQGDVGWNITGGADAALFAIYGADLVFGAQVYAGVPADNVYEVEITAVTCNAAGELIQSAPVTISLTVTEVTKTGGSQIVTQTENMTNLAWTAVGFGTREDNTLATLDQYGTHTLCRNPMSATDTNHRWYQNMTLNSLTPYMLGIVFKRSADAHYAAMLVGFGSGRNVGGTWDLFRGRFVAPRAGSLPIDATACIALANSCYLCLMYFTTPASTAAGDVQFFSRRFAGPLNQEVGITTAVTFANEPILYQTDHFQTYVARTT